MRTVLADCCTLGKRDAGRMMDGISLHYYTVPGEDWDHKGDASVFTTEGYYRTLAKAWRMETLPGNYCDILDEYDPEGRILAGAPDDKNTFDDPEKVAVRDFFADLVDGSYYCAEMPPCSVASFILE